MPSLYTTKSEAGNFEVELFTDEQLQNLPYAILSHTWGLGEVAFKDIKDPKDSTLRSWVGYKKIEQCCSVARKMGYEYVWIDTCCIDKTSSAELSEAINSMFAWYQEANVCYAYLSDVPQTLQELIAPREAIFDDGNWEKLGDKASLGTRISQCTRIPESILSCEKELDMFSTAQRMSWAAERQTTRVEDRAYCLMGLFGVNMPLIYGERDAAFIRLQEEILRISEDHSLFAWKSSDTRAGLLATSPAAFIDSHDIVPHDTASWETFDTRSSPLIISGKGIHLDLCLIGLEHVGLGLAVLQCKKIDGKSTSLEQFKRVDCHDFHHLDLKMYNMDQFRMTRMCIQAGRMTRFKNPADSDECNNFAPIHIYPSFELIRAIDWYSPRAEVYLWLLLTYGNPGVLNVISNGLTPMCRAALNGLDNYVSHLLKRGAATEVGGEVDTPLSLASGSGHTSIVKLLLDKGTNIEARDEETKYGQTALFLASGRPTKDNANLLVKKGALLETKRDAAMRLSRKLHQTILKLFKSES
ncbi:heterokaryon incompatibility protein-domain-containing protein [Aspergillus pseudocaelatus]|uniref:Heterokaryon incompatibility protein-domain-containing protein n=1 Tax=Aspergillus pseudocaelatus TaxID=1825620 RepID=A0ABQ6W375_9EURO|nr:heterokaryon incompatibility protein-domain-containing protein [Aspergillus pseudocaelatus]